MQTATHGSYVEDGFLEKVSCVDLTIWSKPTFLDLTARVC